MGYAEEILRKGLSQHETHHALLHAIHEKYPIINDRNISTLTPGERAFILTTDLAGRVRNDGFDGYFLNTQCRSLYETVRCFALIGARQDLEIIRRATRVARIPEPLPADFEYCFGDEDTTEMDAELAKLDSEFYKSGSDLRHLMIEYVKRHLEEFA